MKRIAIRKVFTIIIVLVFIIVNIKLCYGNKYLVIIKKDHATNTYKHCTDSLANALYITYFPKSDVNILDFVKLYKFYEVRYEKFYFYIEDKKFKKIKDK